MNSAPQILPAIREWSGWEGCFRLTRTTKLVDPPGHVTDWFSCRLGLALTSQTCPEGQNEIRFLFDNALLLELGKEGYLLTVSENYICIRAGSTVGLLYGGITVVQGFLASGDNTFPCGCAKDYPAYPVRSGMLDVARAYIPMEQLYKIGEYMAWFKMNELHLHINDTGRHGYSAFRLESDVPGLTSADGYYSKAEYKAFQNAMLSYGINVITEIDSPYHASCFSKAKEHSPSFLDQKDNVPDWCVGICLDIRKTKTVAFIKSIFTEYLSGDDPVFLAKTVHIGMDEYPSSMKEEMTSYLEQIVHHVNSFGYTARFWSGLATGGCMNKPRFSSEAKVELNYWDFGLSGPAETVSLGYPVVNSINAYLYVVPGNAQAKLGGYTDGYFYTDYRLIYERWQVNLFSLYADKKELLPADHSNLLGAGFSIWNDNHSAHLGLTYRDVIARLPGSVCLTAEKTWCGAETSTIPFDRFYRRYCTHRDSTHMGNLLDSSNEINIEFSRELLPDGISVYGRRMKDHLLLDGNAFISHKRLYVGFPLSLAVELELSALPENKTPLFAGYDKGCELVIYPDGTVGIDAKVTEYDFYHFVFPCRLVVGSRTRLTFRCDGRKTVLLVNDQTYPCINDREHLIADADLSKGRYCTLSVPLWRVGYGLMGKLYSINIRNLYENTTEDYV